MKALARAFRYQRLLDKGRYSSISEMAAAERIERGYGNRVAAQILALEELEGLSAGGRLEVVHVLSEPSPGWAGETGQLDVAVIARRCEAAARAGWLFVLCGPPPMLREARRALRELGVPRARILEERFTYG